ncbi:VOC family protein [Candidatus Kaiserbacteria bacterium]|nr:VOC family protein [Candidatus Kaiserbacteria bacterium]
MLDHIGIYVSDSEKAKAFYTAALEPLGYTLMMELPEWKVAGFGADGKPDFWISPKEEAHNAHVAFAAKGKDQVDAFYKAAIGAGGKDNGAPGYRTDYSPGYFAAFVHDADGNNIEAVFHDPNPSA